MRLFLPSWWKLPKFPENLLTVIKKLLYYNDQQYDFRKFSLQDGQKFFWFKANEKKKPSSDGDDNTIRRNSTDLFQLEWPVQWLTATHIGYISQSTYSQMWS